MATMAASLAVSPLDSVLVVAALTRLVGFKVSFSLGWRDPPADPSQKQITKLHKEGKKSSAKAKKDNGSNF